MPKTVIRLNGRGGELDKIEIRCQDATGDAIREAIIDIATRCSICEGDTITITEE